MGHIQRHHLSEAKVFIPNKEEFLEMDKIISPIFEKIICNEKESRMLIKIRDFLLPNYFQDKF
jgi:type I restriction enzyme S subunit